MNKRVYIVGALLILAFVALGASELVRAQMPYCETVAKVKATPTGHMLQFIGSVVPGKITHGSGGLELIFVMKDNSNDTLTVRYKGARPDGFETAPKVIARGVYNGTDFIAEQLQTKCPSKYQGK